VQYEFNFSLKRDGHFVFLAIFMLTPCRLAHMNLFQILLRELVSIQFSTLELFDQLPKGFIG